MPRKGISRSILCLGSISNNTLKTALVSNKRWDGKQKEPPAVKMICFTFETAHISGAQKFPPSNLPNIEHASISIGFALPNSRNSNTRQINTTKKRYNQKDQTNTKTKHLHVNLGVLKNHTTTSWDEDSVTITANSVWAANYFNTYMILITNWKRKFLQHWFRLQIFFFFITWYPAQGPTNPGD